MRNIFSGTGDATHHFNVVLMFITFLACFSPSVPPMIRQAWGENFNAHICSFILCYLPIEVENGGKVAMTKDEQRFSDWFFCDGMSDPWLTEYVDVMAQNILKRVILHFKPFK